MNKLQKIEINRYRGIKNMILDDLSNINILIGDNNSGKTSILEAVQLLSIPFSTSMIRSVAHQRQRGMLRFASAPPEENLRWIFPQVDGEQQSIQLVLFLNGERKSMTFHYFEEKFLEIPPHLEGVLEAKADEEIVILEQKVNVDVNGEKREISLRPARTEWKEPLYKVEYISASEHRFLPASGRDIGKVILDNKKDELILLLQEFDSSITGLEIIPHKETNNIYIQKNEKELVPLFSCGDGLQKVLLVATAILNTQNGVLLLDEAEVGIHTKMIPVFFEWLSKLSEQHNVTIFLTTHSLEAVDGILAASKESLKNLSFYRLEKNKAKRLSGQRMYEMRYDFAMEVRG